MRCGQSPWYACAAIREQKSMCNVEQEKDCRQKKFLRCLKRYIVRELYPLILTDLGRAQLLPLT